MDLVEEIRVRGMGENGLRWCFGLAVVGDYGGKRL
tara:strand:- start:305 stop:409 length:105 start_codon:yes stop_codon:yes gene_type:complete